MSLEHDNQPEPNPERMLPDLEVCRVKPSGISNLFICLVPDPKDCQHAERTSANTYCFHPATWKFKNG